MIESLKRMYRKIKAWVRAVELLRFCLPLKRSDIPNLFIVTGADSSHFKSLMQFLASLFTYEPRIHVVVFDLGMSASEREQLQRAFPQVELRAFDFTRYPAYFDIKVNAGEFAWKPVILYDMLMEFQRPVCWMDAGNYITARLSWLRRFIATAGLYSPHSRGTLAEWTHPKTLEYFNVPRSMLKNPNLSGGCVGVDVHNPRAMQLIETWRNCALIKECIAPEGSNRENHRQDQAVLSILAHMSGFAKKMPAGLYGIEFHKDVPLA